MSVKHSSSTKVPEDKKGRSRKTVLVASSFKKVLLLMMIGFTLQTNISLKNGNFDNAKRNKNSHYKTEENSTTAITNAIRKMYNGGHLNRDYAKYILLQGRDMMAKLPSFYNVSLPTIYDKFENRTLSKKRITVSSLLSLATFSFYKCFAACQLDSTNNLLADLVIYLLEYRLLVTYMGTITI